MKKNDLILFISIIAIAFFTYLFGRITATKGDTVLILKDGKKFYQGSVYEDKTIDIEGGNTVRIENGCAYMTDATCPDKLCIHQGKTEDSSKKIVCLPNRVTVEITKESGIDKVVR